jgi:hypothetical protein
MLPFLKIRMKLGAWALTKKEREVIVLFQLKKLSKLVKCLAKGFIERENELCNTKVK